MTRFQDGPAAGQTLMLKRAPIFLRVTECKSKWDALDQPGDGPRLDEKLYAYTLVAKPGAAFIDGPKIRGCYPISDYRYFVPQPMDDLMRDNDLWQYWCEHQAPREDLK